MILNNVITLTEAQSGDTFKARLISPGWGSSGYYSADTLRDAAPLYKAGLKVFLNHPTRSEMKERPERDVSQIAGYLETDGVYESYPSPGIYAQVKILPSYQDLVKHAKNVIGLSHIADGKTRIGEAEGRRGTIIEKITKVLSVDIVTDPGRGGRFCESRRNSRQNINSSLDESAQTYFDSLVRSGMSESTAHHVMETQGIHFTPGQKPTPAPGSLESASENLIESYVRSGMAPETARKIVTGI